MAILEAHVKKLDVEKCELGEGPHYDVMSDTAWWFDIVGKKLFEHNFQTGSTQTHTLPIMGSVISTINSQTQLLAMEDGLYLRDIKNSELTLLAALEAEKEHTRSNDGRVHPSGRLWIGTMGKQAQHQAGAIYWFDGQEVRTLFEGITIPNSICFSPDGRVGYFADTGVNTIWRVSLDPLTALPISEPEVFLTGSHLPLGGGFDGCITDADGVLWSAAWGAGSVTGFAPDGSVLQTIEVPAAQTTCPCFVGSELNRMIVTTAYQGYSKEQQLADPGAGYTYLINSDFKGQKDHAFRLEQ
ncbi:MAG: SMP-30/gluconolactonase/LRE family protein [Nitratireductor sp.]